MPESAVLPRLLTPECLARYLGLKRAEFNGMLPHLQKKYQFPNPMPQFGLYDRKVIDLWLDHASGITTDGRYGFHPPERHQLNGAYAPIRHTTRKLVAERSGNPYIVAEAMQDYVAWFRAHHRSPDAVVYKCNACILPHFGHRPVEDLTPPEIRAWHEAIAASPRSRHVGHGKPREYLPPPKTDEEKRKRRMTANGYLMTLKAAFNLAHRDGKVSTDAGWRNVQAFRGVLIGNPAFLTLEECHRLIPLLSPDFRLLVLAALFTGGRLMEISRLAAQDFNIGAGSIHFAPGKTKVARHVALSEEGCRFFAVRVQNLMPADLIFRRLDGQPWRAADPCHRLISPCQQAGLRHITFHAFRHTYASILVMAGTPIAVVAKNLGHRHIETCERYYAHLSRGYVADEIRARMPSFGA